MENEYMCEERHDWQTMRKTCVGNETAHQQANFTAAARSKDCFGVTWDFWDFKKSN